VASCGKRGVGDKAWRKENHVVIVAPASKADNQTKQGFQPRGESDKARSKMERRERMAKKDKTSQVFRKKNAAKVRRVGGGEHAAVLLCAILIGVQASRGKRAGCRGE